MFHIDHFLTNFTLCLDVITDKVITWTARAKLAVKNVAWHAYEAQSLDKVSLEPKISDFFSNFKI